MQTFIISSKNLKRGVEEAEKLIEKSGVDKFERVVDVFEKDLGIDDIRNLKKKIFLKPLRGSKKSNILLIKKGATLDAQNAMLKLLEEPPPSSLIFLVTQNFHIFLPTILSRVKVIEIQDDRKHKNEGLEEILSLKSAGDSLYLAEVVSKDKEKAIVWLEDAILSARDIMLENLDNKEEILKLQNIIKRLTEARNDLKNTNVNPRLALENLLLYI